MKKLIINCGQILTMAAGVKRGAAMSDLGVIEDGFVLIEGDLVSEVGVMAEVPKGDFEVIDAEGTVVMPGLIDCHTHLVFGGNRAGEFKEKLAGKSYLDILADGGGIHSTVKMTRAASKEELIEKALKDLEQFLDYGVTTVEVKSGYGLDLETELKILEVAEEVASRQPVRIKKTFLGAHVVPKRQESSDYLQFLMDEALPAVKGKAEFVDIFCEKGAFSLDQARTYLTKAKEMGFGIKIHAEQINNLGGCKMAAELGAVSVDHCDHLPAGDFQALRDTVAVLLPTVPLYLKEETFADGRGMIDAGLAVAVSTDYNPGSSPSRNIYLAMSLACLKMGLKVEEVLSAVTVNAAAALGMEDVGAIEVGKKADIVIMDCQDYSEIPYWVGDSCVKEVIVGGVRI